LRKEHKHGRRLYRVLIGKPEGKKEITIIIKINHRKIGGGRYVDKIDLLQDGD
jgi:hypothetical protein